MEPEDRWKKDAVFLEEKYAERGLIFTSSFEGLAPIQAYGYLDGMRFYFRLRGGEASLRVGEYDLAVELEKKRLYTQRIRSGGVSLLGETYHMPKESDPQLYPTTLRFFSSTDSSKKRMPEIFSVLVDSLVEVPNIEGI